MKKSKLEQDYDDHRCWGMVASIDCYGCHPRYIKDSKKIRHFIIDLCKAINMKRFGPAMIERFAEGYYEGYSAIQFIETSSVTMHFDEDKNRAFIDIFSCKYFDPKIARDFCQKYLKAKRGKEMHYFRV